jgi:transposase
MSPSTSPPIETEKGGEQNGLSPADQLTLLALGQANIPEITQRRAQFRVVRRFFGLDIHRDYMVATAVDRELQVVYGPRRVEWKHFAEWAQKTVNELDAVVVEMTTNTWEVHDVLRPHVHSVTVVHPPHVKLITQMPVMNEKKASESLAILHAAGLLRGVWVPPQQVRDWRCLVAQRHDRVTAATQAKNRLHAILFRHQIEKPKSSLPFSSKRRDFWRSLPVSPVEKLAIELDLEIIDQAEAQKAKLKKVMTETVLADERLPYLVQLPGVSTLGALTILAAIGTIERFPSAKQLVGYAGLGAKVHDSGQKRSTGKITKSGRRDIRAVLVEAAQTAVIHDPYWKAELKAARTAHGPEQSHCGAGAQDAGDHLAPVHKGNARSPG